MATPNQPAFDQATTWNTTAGNAWVEAQPVMDGMFQRLEHILAAARTRAARENLDATFIQADAQTHAFTPAAYDLLVSRFGVMFFDDPVAAFTNLRAACAPAASLRLLAWRTAAENPFMTTAEKTAAPLLPNLPPRRPGAPGQFAFADRDHVLNVLTQSGWTNPAVEPLDVECVFPAASLALYLMRLGPVGSALEGASEETRTTVLDALLPAFAPYIHGDQVRYTAAVWRLSARA